MSIVLKEARQRLGWTQQRAAAELGIARETVADYEKGRRRSDGRPVVTPRAIELAILALEAGIDPAAAEISPSLQGDDRAYAQWVINQAAAPNEELEEQGRRLFPKTWKPYPYVLIARIEFEDPEKAAQLMTEATDMNAKGEWRFLPVAKEEVQGWELKVRVVVMPTVKDLFVFKSLEVS